MSTAWPELPYAEWKDTCKTLHMYTQVVGKVALSHSSLVNHWWNAGLHVTSRGLSTGTLYEGGKAFELGFDFAIHHFFLSSRDDSRSIRLGDSSVAEFHHAVRGMLDAAGLHPHIWNQAVEIPEPIDLSKDTQDATYQPEYVERFHAVLVQTQRVFEQFRARFTGKCSPVLFWWGTFDLAVARFSGRPADPPPGADVIYREGGNAEQSNCGFWPGDDSFPEPSFYAYTYPASEGFAEQKVSPEAAYFSTEKGEFFLPYDTVRTAADPDAVLLEFCQSAYDAGAKLAQWDPALLRPGAV